ncbi:MAG: 30S ribosome-binding factor RbfA [Atribacterota bacterium]|jgi:ribosome-binding factor A|nr:30S ribosome-binding factor RbfA [Atribacterota bacterium]MDD5496912.1 30S ribosome-binding factor RbfA [Atribacterota bacterium]
MVSEQKKKHFEKLLKRNISHIIYRKTKDPRIGFVTVTRIALSNDLHNAKIYISILGSKEEQERGMKGLSSATKFIRAELAYELRQYRFTPNISFHYDQELEGIHQLMIKAQQLEQEDKDWE